MAAAVDVSWRRLLARDPSAARLAQLCTLNPGPGLETEAAQALDGRSEAEVRGSLRALRQAHLLSKADGHWQMHDLVRQQLRERAMPRPADAPAAALTRLLEYYLQAVSRRDTEWFESERVTLVAAVPVAVATGLDGLAADLAAAVCAFLTEQCDLDVRLVLCRHEAEAAARLGDTRRRAKALARLGTTLVAAARFSEGLSALDDALEIWRAVADAEQVAEALHTRGLCLVQAARHRQAVSTLRESAEQFRALEFPLREAQVLDDLAEAASTLHDLEEALSAARRSAALFADAGERQSELHLGVTLAALHARNGRYALAVSGVENTARVAKNEGYPEVEARACAQLALLHAQTGRQRKAAAYRQRAVAILRETGDTEAENLLTMQLSAAVTAMADDVDAASALQQQVEYCRSSGNRNGEGDALHRLGLLLSDRAKLTAAYQVHLKAVEVWRDLGNRHREGAELAALAKAFAAVNRLAAARRTADEAVEALTDSGAADEAAALRDWVAQLPPDSEDEPEELSYVTTVVSEKRSGCAAVVTVIGVVVATIYDAPWWALAGWSLLLASVRTGHAAVSRRSRRGTGAGPKPESIPEPMLEGAYAQVKGCLSVCGAAALVTAYVVGGPWGLLVACTLAAGCWVSGKQGVVVFTVIGVLIVHFTWGTWWMAFGLVAPFVGYRNTMGLTFAGETKQVEVG
ncbi:tetratricopeptide repeat protein [Streptomyces tubbatahanensis]|uniref:Tetratricopeptide repeat protein n=1 Tax=Streptomyces tubbatahanensis TaxID=2923272 RepID=A0ABY3Y2F1_9ACTN|nr:tetratricopeptide repeat protein [Streptomyces tubbatahanensis]UNT00794.1 tetratricopeptide repeat protein [Streptomyces tubbatahanensis]